mmetsp:Transcript_38591/g.62526  ORF Transcript_38591/g.62526 Transcript_38591/m.62526 type:complete len:282 (-) Transcript_38591:527-1372(-)|eukprot:CAMPEP_0184673692 /NCGR_PEP_ID=MMETSP0308-20130426/86819_1 /TAXON_ID=38269 /ORGANISM="Gloeochaete witrockiana, Strain SAG 46.84" /LENGTH=281 /DNA_ID=CAMNT_0027121207 /DNA_START=31 /DNA_END=876 /DNA_ORIENTATION=-
MALFFTVPLLTGCSVAPSVVQSPPRICISTRLHKAVSSASKREFYGQPLRSFSVLSARSFASSAVRMSATEIAVPAEVAADVKDLARLMCADWDNEEQHRMHPPFHSHIRVSVNCIPKEHNLSEKLGLEKTADVWLYLENAYFLALDQPYRQAVLRIAATEDGRIKMENWKLSDPKTFAGAARDPSKLKAITADVLERSEGCSLYVEKIPTGYKGETEPGKKCTVLRKGVVSYLHSSFEITPDTFFTLDVGRNPENDEQLWGAVAGPFEFFKLSDFSAYVS